MSTNHNRIKVADLEVNQPDKILTTNSKGELDFTDIKNIKAESYNGLDYTQEGKALDARQGKALKDSLDNLNSNLNEKENTSNKVQDIEINKNSSTAFPSIKSIYDWSKGLFKTWILSIENFSSTAYTLNAENINKRTVFSSSSPVTITIPNDSVISLPIGTKKEFTQKGTGLVTINGTGISFITNIPLTISNGETRILTKTGANEWLIDGFLVNTNRRSFNINFAWHGTYGPSSGVYTPDREAANLNSPVMSVNNSSQGFAVPFRCKLKAAVHAGNALGSSDLTLYVLKKSVQSGQTTIAATKPIIGTYAAGKSFPFIYDVDIDKSIVWETADYVSFGFLNPTTSTGVWRTPSLSLYFEEEF